MLYIISMMQDAFGMDASNFEKQYKVIYCSVADLGCLSRILIFIHPGSQIPDPGSQIQQQEQKRRGERFVVLLFLQVAPR
jgi:hypothetical protein